jgi:hypothetical protein
MRAKVEAWNMRHLYLMINSPFAENAVKAIAPIADT